jgi:hypothetical protein
LKALSLHHNELNFYHNSLQFQPCAIFNKMQ